MEVGSVWCIEAGTEVDERVVRVAESEVRSESRRLLVVCTHSESVEVFSGVWKEEEGLTSSSSLMSASFSSSVLFAMSSTACKREGREADQLRTQARCERT